MSVIFCRYRQLYFGRKVIFKKSKIINIFNKGKMAKCISKIIKVLIDKSYSMTIGIAKVLERMGAEKEHVLEIPVSEIEQPLPTTMDGRCRHLQKPRRAMQLKTVTKQKCHQGQGDHKITRGEPTVKPKRGRAAKATIADRAHKITKIPRNMAMKGKPTVKRKRGRPAKATIAVSALENPLQKVANDAEQNTVIQNAENV